MVNMNNSKFVLLFILTSDLSFLNKVSIGYKYSGREIREAVCNLRTGQSFKDSHIPRSQTSGITI